MPDDGPTYGAGTANEDESDAEAREARGEFAGKYTYDRLYQLQSELKGAYGKPLTPDLQLKLNEFNKLMMQVREQQARYPGKPNSPFAQKGFTQDRKGDKSNLPQKLGGPEDEDDSPMQDIAKDIAAVPGAAFHALAMRPYNAGKTLMSPEGQYQPGTGDEEGVRLGNTAASAIATSAFRGGGGIGAFGGRGARRPEPPPMEAETAELQKISEAIEAATQHLNALGAKKASGQFGKAEFESVNKIQAELPELMKRGQALQLKIQRSKQQQRNTTQPRQYGYDPANKKPGAHATGLPAPQEETLEQFQAEGNL